MPKLAKLFPSWFEVPRQAFMRRLTYQKTLDNNLLVVGISSTEPIDESELCQAIATQFNCAVHVATYKGTESMAERPFGTFTATTGGISYEKSTSTF